MIAPVTMVHTILTHLRQWRMKKLKPFAEVTSPDALRLTIGDLNGDIARTLASEFADVPDVQVIEGNLLDADCDAILSPANSFGDMGGGIDKAIDDFHQGAAQRAVRAAIATHFLGELPVGMALVAEVSTARFPFIVVAPTMRVPGLLNGGINAYLSMRAALIAVRRHNIHSSRTIRTMAVPGLCTGIGGMTATESAAQMRTAYDQVIGEQWRKVMHPMLAPYATRRTNSGD